jgi:murein tripeptide amidase MpaA
MKVARLVLFVFPSLLISNITFSQSVEKYSRVKVYADVTQSNLLSKKGIALDELAERTATSFTGDFSSKEISIFKQSGLKTEVIINDLSADFLQRNALDNAQNNVQLRTGGTPTGFNYGSMGGYLTYSEMMAELDELKTLYPNLITTKSSIGTSLEGRAIWMVKISDNPTSDESQEPGVIYSGLHHAREPLSMMSLIYYMYYILSQYGTDPEITCLINNRELYFVPCLNPDGYVYNQTTNPSGGGLWRKNRRNNGDGTFGVDLNRNYSYFWGYDNSGSSATTSSEIYRGSSAASEPEVTAYSNFVNSKQLSAGLNYHTYGEELILPFAYNNSPTSDENHYRNIAGMLTAENKFGYGRPYEVLYYNVNGSTTDWLYGTRNIISFDPELGTEADGFWPVQSRILPICESTLDMNISLAWAAGSYIKPRIDSDLYVSGYSYNLPVRISNYGSSQGTTETIALSFNDSRILQYDATPVSASGIMPDDTQTFLKSITFKSNATTGPVNGNLVVTNTEGCTYNLPISFQYSPAGCFPIPSSWTAADIGSPGLAGSSCYQNGTYTIKGSGLGVTGTSDKCHMMSLTTSTDVLEIKAQVLTDQNTSNGARAGITISETTAPGSKRISLFVNPSNNKLELHARTSTNGNINITGINGAGTVPKWLRLVKSSGGNYYAYYSSNGVQWTSIGKQKVNMVTNVTAGLVVTSGSSSNLHTATFNNLAVTTPGGVINRTMADASSEIEEGGVDGFSIYPNPGNGIIDVVIPAGSFKQTLKVFDLNGKIILNQIVTPGARKLNLTQLPAGIYYMQISDGINIRNRKFIIAK